MENELYRLATYGNFPMQSPVHPIRLAAAGFHYEGNQDEVTCFQCNFKHANWKKGQEPLKTHLLSSPGCLFIKQHTKAQSKHSKKENEKERKQMHENGHSVNEMASLMTTSEACNGPADIRNRKYLFVDGNVKSKILKELKNVVEKEAVNDQNTVNARLKHVDTSAEPCLSHPTSHEVVFNSERQPNSTSSDVTTGNKNILTKAVCQCSQSSPSLEALHQTAPHFDNQTALDPLGVNTTPPKYPSFAIQSIRHASYKEWPSHLRQQPHDLAKAGFFYEGNGDDVRCFFCAGGLKEWEPEDDPWIEHARWFPKCLFLRQCKGDRFVENIQAGKMDTVNSPQNQMNTGRSKEHNDTIPTTPNNQNGFDMDDPAVLSVVEMGCSIGAVKRAFLYLQKEKETKTISSEILLQAIWDMDEIGAENRNKKSENFESNMKCSDHNEEKTEITSEGTHALLKKNEALKEIRQCKICLDEEASIVFLPCGHLVSCTSCAQALLKCPVCRTYVRGTIKAILS